MTGERRGGFLEKRATTRALKNRANSRDPSGSLEKKKKGERRDPRCVWEELALGGKKVGPAILWGAYLDPRKTSGKTDSLDKKEQFSVEKGWMRRPLHRPPISKEGKERIALLSG